MIKKLKLLEKIVIDPEEWVKLAAESGIYDSEESALNGKINCILKNLKCDCIEDALELLKDEDSRKDKEEKKEKIQNEKILKAVESSKRNRKQALRKEILEMKKEGLI